MNLRYALLPATAWLGCPGTAALRSGIVLKEDVRLTISSSKTEFAADEPVLVDVSLKNPNPKEAATLLDWVIPCDIGDENENTATDMLLFDVKTTGGAAVDYKGAKIKRAKPDKVRDFRVLRPGEEISCAIDLAKYFDFSAPSDDDEYVVSYEAVREELSGTPSESDGAHKARPIEALTSNALRLTILAREFVYPLWVVADRNDNNLRGGGPNLETGDDSLFFEQCDVSQITAYKEAYKRAYFAIKEATVFMTDAGLAGSLGNHCPRYVEWFDYYEASRHDEIRIGFQTMLHWMENAAVNANQRGVVINCACGNEIEGNEYTFGFVYQDLPGKLFLCPAFWSAEMTGRDSKMGVIVHEVSHYYKTAATEDYAYGDYDSYYLALDDPHLAINNADNHEYFAENTPYLACDSPPKCPEGKVPLFVDIVTDEYPEETSWTLTDCEGNVFNSVESGAYTEKNTLYSWSGCVRPGPATFTFKDSEGDGICCDYGHGSYTVSRDYKVVMQGGELQGSEENVTFGGSCGADDAAEGKKKTVALNAKKRARLVPTKYN